MSGIKNLTERLPDFVSSLPEGSRLPEKETAYVEIENAEFFVITIQEEDKGDERTVASQYLIRLGRGERGGVSKVLHADTLVFPLPAPELPEDTLPEEVEQSLAEQVLASIKPD